MINEDEYNLIETKIANKPTIEVKIDNKRYYLYSKYNPERDSRLFAEENYDENTKEYIVYGLGLGYHIFELEAILKKENIDYHIYVIEVNKNIIDIARKNRDIFKMFSSPRVTFIELENNKESYVEISKILSSENIKLAIHRPSMNIIPSDFLELKYLLEEFIVKENTIQRFSKKLDENFKSNIIEYSSNVDELFEKNKNMNKSLYLIAAGPSLDKNIEELKNIEKEDIILSVGRAVRPLLKKEIIPDYIIITDPKEGLYKMQLQGLNIDVPIIVMSTCDKDVMLKYKGKKYIALQKGYILAEEYARKNNNRLINTGGSVATAALDVAIKMGFKKIIFVGQDLAFTENKTHSKDTFSKEIPEDMGRSFREVESIKNEKLRTSKNLYIYLRWIENRIKKEKDIEFIDSTEGGAKIRGTKIMKLVEAIKS